MTGKVRYSDDGRTQELTQYIRTFLEFDLGQSSPSRSRNSIRRTVSTDATTPKNPSPSSDLPVFQRFRYLFSLSVNSTVLTLVLVGTPPPPPLRTLLSNLPATHARFFDMLSAELDKVETFYAEREKEMLERTKRLRGQLNELGLHRRMCNVGALHWG